MRIEVSKEGVRFAAEGEAAIGSVLLKHTESVTKDKAGSSSKSKKAKKEEDAEEEGEEGDEEEKVSVFGC